MRANEDFINLDTIDQAPMYGSLNNNEFSSQAGFAGLDHFTDGVPVVK